MPSPRPGKDAPMVALPLALCLSVFALLLVVAIHGSGHDRRPTVHCPVKPTATSTPRTAPTTRPGSGPCRRGTVTTVPDRAGTPAARRRPGSGSVEQPDAPGPVQPPRKQPAAPKAPPAAPKPVQPPAPPRPAIP